MTQKRPQWGGKAPVHFNNSNEYNRPEAAGRRQEVQASVLDR